MNIKRINKLLKLIKIFALIAPIISNAVTLASGNTVSPTGSAGEPGGDPIDGDPVPI